MPNTSRQANNKKFKISLGIQTLLNTGITFWKNTFKKSI